MSKKSFVIMSIMLISLISLVNASSSTSWVNFTVNLNNGSCGGSFGCFVGHVSDLKVESRGTDWLYLTWKNTADIGFSYNSIFLDSFLVGQDAGEFFNVTGLDQDTLYKISIISISDSGKEGTLVSISGKTLGDAGNGNDDKEIRRGHKKTGMQDDVIPNFFSGAENKVSTGNIVIPLENSYVESSYDWWTLFLWILGLSIVILLVSIFILLIR